MKVNFNRIIIPSSRENLLSLFTRFIQCKICMNLLNDPYDCLCCNQTFCKSCIINYIKTNNKCPFSEFFDINNKQYLKEKPNIHELLNKIKPSSSNFAKIIQSLKFYCQNNDKGCNAELNIEEISEHEKICKYKVKKIKVELNNKNKNLINSTFKKKENNPDNMNNLYDEKFNSFDSNNDLLQFNKNNGIKHQDSVVSFSGIKNLSENKDANQFYLNENSINNIYSNSKIEKSIEEINQKLSYINNFIINNYENKYISTNYKSKNKSNRNDYLSDLDKTENNDTGESKVLKRNSMTITNNFYDGSYINTVNNFTNENLDNNNCFNTINNNLNNNIDNKSTPIKICQKPKKIKFNNKDDNKNKEKEKDKDNKDNKDKKNNKFCHSLKSRKNTMEYFINSKHKKSEKNKKDKKIEILEEKNNKEKFERKEKFILKNQIINNISNATPKLGGKSQSHINDIKPFDLKLNLNIENTNKKKSNNNIINSIFSKNSDNTHPNINEDIFNGIKNLNCKITDIERLLQSNNSFKNQAYSIQNEDMQNDNNNEGNTSIKSPLKEIKNVKKNINSENKENKESKIINEEKNENNNLEDKKNINEEDNKIKNEKILENFDEKIGKIEINLKNILKEKFDNMKKYIGEQLIEEIKKSVLDTNFDIMTLCTEKLDEFEKTINEKFNNIKI